MVDRERNVIERSQTRREKLARGLHRFIESPHTHKYLACACSASAMYNFMEDNKSLAVTFGLLTALGFYHSLGLRKE